MKTIIRWFAGAVDRVPWLVLGVTLLTSLALGASATTVETATGQEGFSPESDEIAAAERIEELFGGSANQTVMQVLVSSEDDDVLTAEAVSAVRDAIENIVGSEAARYISEDPARPGVVSYLSPVFAAAEGEGVDVTNLSDDDVKTLYADALKSAPDELGFAAQLTPEGSDSSPEFGLVLVFIDSTTDADAQIERETAVAEALDEVTSPTIQLEPFSFGLLMSEQEDFLGEVGRLFALAFTIIVVVLLFVYWMKPRGRTARGAAARRTVADTAVTMLTIVLAILWMNGIGAVLQRLDLLDPFTEVAQIVPILLVGLGVDYGIHLTSRYRDEVGDGQAVRPAMRTAIGTVGVALLLATVTTAVGFLTNLVNPIPALRDFGILASVGIVTAFVLMLTFVPALRSVLDRRAEAGGRLPVDGMGATRERLLPGLVAKTSVLAERAPIPTLVVAFTLGGLGFLGFTNLSTEFSFTDFLPEDSPAVEVLNTIEEEFGGGFGETTQVLIEGADPATPEVFNAISQAAAEMADTEDVLTVPGPAGDAASVSSPASVVLELLRRGAQGAPDAEEFSQLAVDSGLDPERGVFDTDGDVAVGVRRGA